MIGKSRKSAIKRAVIGITDEVLLTLKDLSQLIPRPFETKYGMVKRLHQYESGQVSRALDDLSREGYVHKSVTRKKVYYSITDLGRARAIKYSLQKKPRKVKGNGLSTVIIFDIPEEKRKARDFLRRFLVQNGFIMLQRSVFIGRFEVDSEFREMLRELKINLNVSILEARILFT